MVKGRKDDSHTNGQGKGTFRFRYMDSNRQFEVSADNVSGESLLEGFRQVAGAIAGRVAAAEPSRRLPKNAGGASADVLEEKDDEIIETDVLPFPEQPADADPEEEEDGSSETAAKTKRKIKAPNVLAEPNLTTAKVSLDEFMKQKSPTEKMDKYAVVTVWYKQEFNIAEMTIDRIYTAFKHLGIDSQLPTDVEKPLKNLTYVKKWFIKSKAPGAYEINWVGEDAVNKMGAVAKP